MVTETGGVVARVRILAARRAVVAALAATLLLACVAVTAPSYAAAPKRDQREPVTPCSRGLVALTFDDGPSATVTPRLVRVLRRLQVPATFFLVGTRITTAPEAARLVEHAGFVIGNHTWAHTDLTTQSADEIRAALRATRKAMRHAGLTPTWLMRPPYGALDDAARRVVEGAGYTPVLWTIDSRDWTGLTPAQITARVLDGVRRRATNIVLQHDGVTNSPATVKAVPAEVAELRRRGFCFAALDASGAPTPPVPVATITDVPRRVREGDKVPITVRLDRPTSRPTSVAVVTQHVTTSRADFGWTSRRVRFAVGQQVAHLRLPVWRDGTDEPGEDVDLVLSRGRGLTPAEGTPPRVRVVDLDDQPLISARDGVVTASNAIDVTGAVTVRLSRPSGWDVRVRLRTHRLSARPDRDYVPTAGWVTIPAGERTATLPVTVRPGPVTEDREVVGVDVLDVRHATLTGDAVAWLTIRPAATRIAPRLTPSGPDWF
jgi:peptidoglycan/xylan/chitin deacetylase (PgdA/CDA1 family)